MALFVVLGFASLQFYRFGPRYFGLNINPPQRAFYFWKTRWISSPEILTQLNKNQIHQLYMRFFDVEWNETRSSAQPVSPLEVVAPLPTKVEIVPVVYITNSVFLKMNYADVEGLGDKIWRKVNAIARAQNVVIRQLQIDCDWSDGSRRNYFHFAELLHSKLKTQKVILSSTIRLHQIKYAKRTGVPPVDRGMLMFYNFGRIKADSDYSSIFNSRDAGLYAKYIASYKLPLDLSLPIFSWGVHSRDGKVVGLLSKMNVDDFESSDGFLRIAHNKLKATQSFFFRGTYYAKDDLILIEETSPTLTKQAAAMAIEGSDWKKSYNTVAFFDIDERNLSRYGKNDIQQIFKQF